MVFGARGQGVQPGDSYLGLAPVDSAGQLVRHARGLNVQLPRADEGEHDGEQDQTWVGECVGGWVSAWVGGCVG